MLTADGRAAARGPRVAVRAAGNGTPVARPHPRPASAGLAGRVGLRIVARNRSLLFVVIRARSVGAEHRRLREALPLSSFIDLPATGMPKIPVFLLRMVGRVISHYRDRRADRCGRHGCRLQGRGHAARPPGRAEVPARRAVARPAGARALPARSARRLRAQPSEHLHDLRHRRVRGPAVHRDGAARRRSRSTSIDRRQAAADRQRARPRRSRSPTRSTPRTRRASSTATSSRRTSSSPSAGRPRCSTSGSPSWRRRAATRFGGDGGAAQRVAGEPADDGAGWRSAPSPTCRRSRRAARTSISDATCSRSASCCTRWRRASRLPGQHDGRGLRRDPQPDAAAGREREPRGAARARANHRQGDREGSRRCAIRPRPTCARICSA